MNPDADIAPPAWAESDAIARGRMRTVIVALATPLAAHYTANARARGETYGQIARVIGKSPARTRDIDRSAAGGYTRQWSRAHYRDKVARALRGFDALLGDGRGR